MKSQATTLSSALKQEFQKDLELFKHFLLLLNNAGPIRNVELMWNEELDPMKPKYKNRVSTQDALVQLQTATDAEAARNSPSTMFCDLVHGFGNHEEETCAKSDIPAQKRCRATGCSQVYACHVGLTDIAVPVSCDGQYLGTLFSGQVLTEPPTLQRFKEVRKALAGQKHIDFESLKAAYFRVPVVTKAQLAEMVRVLELFSRYIANSWKRLQIISEHQHTRDRQLALDRKELAATLLSGELGDLEDVKQLARRSGLQKLPNRVMVLKIQGPGTDGRASAGISTQLSLNRLSHIIEDFCQNWSNTLAMVVRAGEVCVFTRTEGRNAGHEQITLREMGECFTAEVQRSAKNATARVGISAEHAQPGELVRAYQEACLALDSSHVAVSFFSDTTARRTHAVEAIEKLVKSIQQGKMPQAGVSEFIAQAFPPGDSSASIQHSRAFLTWAVEHLALEVLSIGAEAAQIEAIKEQTITGVVHATSTFSACQAFRRFCDNVAEQIASLFSKREQKIVVSISRLVEGERVAHVTIQDLADALHLSAGHLSRVFRRTTGMTLEEFLIRQRIELARRVLLDPRLNVSEVAERCGFCNPAYFSSVFKKYVHCTPREFARHPDRWLTVASQVTEAPAAAMNA